MKSPEINLFLTQIRQGKLLMVDHHRRNGLILIKPFYAEFAGPGAAVGGVLDQDCRELIPVGNFNCLTPNSPQERLKAYDIRKQWVHLIEKLTTQVVPLERAQILLTHLAYYFDQETVAKLPNEVLCLLVGVFPKTIQEARANF